MQKSNYWELFRCHITCS